MQMRPYNDKKWVELPHVLLTSDKEWGPSLYDDDSITWFDLNPPPVMNYSIEYMAQRPITVPYYST